jgi:hypothetical protein
MAEINKRSRNVTDVEKNILLDLITSQISIIENLKVYIITNILLKLNNHFNRFKLKQNKKIEILTSKII